MLNYPTFSTYASRELKYWPNLSGLSGIIETLGVLIMTLDGAIPYDIDRSDPNVRNIDNWTVLHHL